MNLHKYQSLIIALMVAMATTFTCEKLSSQSDFHVEGKALIDSSLTVGKNLVVIGTGFFQDGATVTGITSLIGTTQISGTANISGTTNLIGPALVVGFTKLGADAPAIKIKKITGTTHADGGSSNSVSHTLDASKIISVTGVIFSGPNYTNASNYVDFVWGPGFISFSNNTSFLFVLEKPISITVVYEE